MDLIPLVLAPWESPFYGHSSVQPYRHRHSRAYNVTPYGGGYGMAGILGGLSSAMSAMDREMRTLSEAMESAAPQITDNGDGQKQLNFKFDVHGFRPENITLRTRDNRLEVSALSESEHGRREYHQFIHLPEGTSLEQMSSQLTADGVLAITAPYIPPQPKAIEEQQQSGPVNIPITHEKSSDKRHLTHDNQGLLAKGHSDQKNH